MQSLFDKFARYPERAIVLFGLALLLAGNWIPPLTDRDEVRFAEASREMIQRGDYVVPWFNGAWRFDKPVLIYWAQIASYKLFGISDFTARLPSALFTTGTALILVRWGRRVADGKTGLLAGLMFVACLHIALIGRVATADMALIFFFTLAFWSGWELTRPQQPQRHLWWWIFYAALALGFLAKGPEIYFAFCGLILGRILRKDDFYLPTGVTLVGFILSFGLIALWGIPAILQTHGEYYHIGIGEHVIHRSTGVTDGHGLAGFGGYLAMLPLYFITFFISFLPWTIGKPGGLLFIPRKIRNWWPERRHDSIGWYLFVQVAVVFVIFTLVRTKLPHYTAPAFPCIALWLALQVTKEKNVGAWAGKRALGMAIFIAVLMFGFFPWARNYFLTENLWRAVQPHVRPEMKVGCYGFSEASLVWRFRNVVTNTVVLGQNGQVANFLATNSPPYILVLPTSQLTNLPDTNGLLIRVHGLDIVRFKNWDLTAIIRE